MPLVTSSVSSTEWTLISANTNVVSFQNIGSWPICVAYSASNTAPEDALGWVYPPYQGEQEKDIGLLSPLSAGYVFVRSLSNVSTVIHPEIEEE